ncbi:MAG: GGDEF domain-containing protein [Chloroflexi bacterium]|nr:GGDEF domain-containing protein [Chloroflexota bacterium]
MENISGTIPGKQGKEAAPRKNGVRNALARLWLSHWGVGSIALGVGFALASYIVGTWIYSWETAWFSGIDAEGDPLQLLLRIPTHHPFTAFPWLVGTSLLALVFGRLFTYQAELARRLEAMAVTDGLTLVYNHRYFVQQLGLEIKRIERATQNVFSLLLLDLDNFKKYNDTHGHLAGDDCLRLVAQAIRSAIRETDLVARYGGEEFVVIAFLADAQQGVLLGERIRTEILGQTPITVSIGVASFPDAGSSVEELIRAADMAMYSAKGGGKNQVSVAKPSTGTGRPTGGQQRSDLEVAGDISVLDS